LDRLAGAFREVYRLRQEVVTDPLTGLLNRMALTATEAHAAWPSWTTIMVDVDDFKRFNDLHGHQVGDKVLEQVGRCIKDSIRGTDRAFRYGGEEFLILCPATTVEQSTQVVHRIQNCLSRFEWPITISVGVVASDEGHTLEDSIREADSALYQAKGAGKNRFVVSSAGLVVAD
jgi:diguanylate cyclase (GGDEF)-like protein